MIAPGRSRSAGTVEVDETEMPAAARTILSPGWRSQSPGQNPGDRRHRGAGRRGRTWPHPPERGARLLGQQPACLPRRQPRPRCHGQDRRLVRISRRRRATHDPHVVGNMAAHIVLPWVHRTFSNLKVWALGVYHGCAASTSNPTSTSPCSASTAAAPRRRLPLPPRHRCRIPPSSLQELDLTGSTAGAFNDDIASLVKQGLSPLVQKSLDVVRVVGNEAVHPGTIDLRDNRDVASKLFRLVNVIVEQMISHPKHVNDLYDNVVPDSKQQIAKRDAEKP